MRTCLKCGGGAMVDFDLDCAHDMGERADALRAKAAAHIDVLRACGAFSGWTRHLFGMHACLLYRDYEGALRCVDHLGMMAAEAKAHPLITFRMPEVSDEQRAHYEKLRELFARDWN